MWLFEVLGVFEVFVVLFVLDWIVEDVVVGILFFVFKVVIEVDCVIDLVLEVVWCGGRSGDVFVMKGKSRGKILN